MVTKYYDSSVTASQTTMAGVGQGNGNPTNDPAGFTEIKRIIECYTDKTATWEDADYFSGTKLRAKIDAGNPVIYLSTRIPLSDPDIKNPPRTF